MPITKSAKKANRQNIRRKESNFKIKTELKSLLKEVKTLILQKKIEEAKKLLPKIYKTLDKAAKEGLIKKGNASRNKSRIAGVLTTKK